MASKGTEFLPESQVTAFTTGADASTRIVTFGNAESHCVSVLLSTAPRQVPSFVADAGLASLKELVLVDLITNCTQAFDQTYCVGDTRMAMLPAVHKPHPRAGDFAAPIRVAVAHTLNARLLSLDDAPAATARNAVRLR